MSIIVDIGRVLGIPGVVILCWYLLEVRKGERAKATEASEQERQRANDKRAAALERMRIDAENKRTEAMSKGFERLGELITNHAREDLEFAERANGPCWPSKDDRFEPYALAHVEPPCFWRCDGGAGCNALSGCFGCGGVTP